MYYSLDLWGKRVASMLEAAQNAGEIASLKFIHDDVDSKDARYPARTRFVFTLPDAGEQPGEKISITLAREE